MEPHWMLIFSIISILCNNNGIAEAHTSSQDECKGISGTCKTVKDKTVGNEVFESNHIEVSYPGARLYFVKNEQRTVNFTTYHSDDICSGVYAFTKVFGRDISGDTITTHAFLGHNCCPKLLQGKNIDLTDTQIKTFEIQLDGPQEFIKQDGSSYLDFVPLMSPMYIGHNSMSEAVTNDCNNFAPQFHSIHQGNWQKTQEYIAWYVKWYTNWEAEIHVMRAGTLAFPAYVSQGVNYNAWRDDYGKIRTSLPIPEYFAAVLIYRESKQGYVYVTLNNPYLDDKQAKKRAEQLCPAGYWTSHVSWDVYDMRKGYSFFCYVYDFFNNNDLPVPQWTNFHEIQSGYKL